MSSSIPYDPSLVIGNIIPREKLNNIKKIAEVQAGIEAKEQYLDSLIRLRRTLDIHIQEMIGLGIDIKELIKEVEDVHNKIHEASIEYSKVKVGSENQISELKKTMPIINDSVESPVNFSESKNESLPLSANSMQMNTKYFSYINVDNDKKNNGKNKSISEIINFMKNNSNIDNKTIENQAHTQQENNLHENIGTLVICINCTHQMASIYNKLVLDPTKAINTWNAYFQDDSIDLNNLENSLLQNNKNSMEIISGATYGSSFIALIHVSTTHQMDRILSLEDILKKTQESIREEILKELKVLGIFDKTVQMNCNIITNGIVPNFKKGENKKTIGTIFDIDTMINVLDNYIDKVNNTKETFGVPINYYTKKITKKDILNLLKKENPIPTSSQEKE